MAKLAARGNIPALVLKRPQALRAFKLGVIPLWGVTRPYQRVVTFVTQLGVTMFLDSYRKGGTKAVLDFRPSRACHIEISGIITPSTLVDIDNHAARVALGALVWIADFTAAAVAMTDCDLAKVTEMLTPEDPFSRPIAIVCREDSRSLFERHAANGASRSFTRLCFYSLEAAQRWADRMANMLALHELESQPPACEQAASTPSQ